MPRLSEDKLVPREEVIGLFYSPNELLLRPLRPRQAVDRSSNFHVPEKQNQQSFMGNLLVADPIFAKH